MEILMSTMKTRICLTNSGGVEEFACLLHSSDELFHKTIEEKQQRTKKRKILALALAAEACQAKLAPNWLTCRHVEPHAAMHCGRRHGWVASFKPSQQGACISSPVTEPHLAWEFSHWGAAEEWEKTDDTVHCTYSSSGGMNCGNTMSRALVFCRRCWVFVSLSTSTDDGLSLTKRSPVLCNPWIRDVWAWFLKWILYVEQLLWSAPCAPVYTEATTHAATSFHDWSQLCRCSVKCSTPCSRITCHFLVHSN